MRGGQSLFKPSQPPSCLSSPTTKTFSILNGLSFSSCCNIKCYISFFTSKPYFKKENFHIKFFNFFLLFDDIDYSITRNIFRTCFIMCLFVHIVISVFLYKCISVLECRRVFLCLFFFSLLQQTICTYYFFEIFFFRFLFFLVRILLCSLMALALIA